jgi:hypothetical protein
MLFVTDRSIGKLHKFVQLQSLDAIYGRPPAGSSGRRSKSGESTPSRTRGIPGRPAVEITHIETL